MAKIKFTKGELKRQVDALKQFQHYLPTLQLKKQQLQLEILQLNSLLETKKQEQAKLKQGISLWVGLLSDPCVDLKVYLKPQEIHTSFKNIAGVDIPIFEKIDFFNPEYDLFLTPLWLDYAILAFRETVTQAQEIDLTQEGVNILKQELRVITQRVNLFEKVKIPAAQENIRLIKIYIGDQMANAVGRCKIAKRKIEELVLTGGGS